MINCKIALKFEMNLNWNIWNVTGGVGKVDQKGM